MKFFYMCGFCEENLELLELEILLVPICGKISNEIYKIIFIQKNIHEIGIRYLINVKCLGVWKSTTGYKLKLKMERKIVKQ